MIVVRPRRVAYLCLVVGWFALAVLAAALAIGAPGVALSGGSFGLVLAVIVVVLPVALYAGVSRPLIVPFALWAGLVPLENVFAIRGGSIERLIGILVIGAVLVRLLLRGRSLVLPRAAMAWCAYCAFSVASLMWTPDPAHSITLLITLAAMLAGVALPAALPCDRVDLRWIFSAVVTGGVATAVYAVWIMMHTHLTGEIQRLFFGRPDLLIDPNFVGASLVFPAIISFVACTVLQKPQQRIACGVAALVIVVGILISESRGALVALGCGFGYAFLRSRVKLRFLPIVLGAAATIAAYPKVLDRFSDPHYAHGSGRTDIWRVGYAAFHHHWLVGSGFGSFRDAYQAAYLEAYQPTAFAEAMQDAHNLIVYVGVESGVIGLLLIAWAYVEQFRLLRKIGPSSGGWYDARMALEASMLAMLVNSLSIDLVIHRPLWLCIGAAWIFWSGYRTVRAQAANCDGLPNGGNLR